MRERERRSETKRREKNRKDVGGRLEIDRAGRNRGKEGGTEGERERDRQRDRERERERQTDRQTDRQKSEIFYYLALLIDPSQEISASR